MKKRLSACIAALVMIITIMPVSTFSSGRYGDMPIYIGQSEVDYMADQILRQIPAAGKSPTEKIRAVYDWIITHCTRYENEWDGTYYFNESTVNSESVGYGDQAYAQVESGNAVIRREYASEFDPSAFYDTAMCISSYAYSMMMTRNGNCLHYASLLTVLLGHLGFDCRIVDGYFKNADGTMPVHKWNYVLVDGVYYWLDVRMDHANYVRTGKINYQYFMIADTSAWERNHQWDHTYSDKLRDNAGNIAADYNETANDYANAKELNVVASRSGYVSGDGVYFDGSQATLTAYTKDAPFAGWYDRWGNLLSTENPFTVTVSSDAVYYALFEGDVFADIPDGTWYLNDVMEAYERDLVKGMTSVTFEGKTEFTRAMVATILARITGDDITQSAQSPFTDVPQGAWYASAVNWAYENGIVLGRTDTTFDPNSYVTRQEFVAMAIRYLNSKGYTQQAVELDYTDNADISEYAREYIGAAQAIGLVDGYPDGTIKPKNTLTRAEGTVIVLRISDYIENSSSDEEITTNIQGE